MDKLIEQIDGIKTMITDQEYIELMDSMQQLYNAKHPCWEDISDKLLDDDAAFGQHFSMPMLIALECSPHRMVEILAKALDHEQRACAKQQSVIAYISTLLHDTRIRFNENITW
jgi:hypothetical protein